MVAYFWGTVTKFTNFGALQVYALKNKKSFPHGKRNVGSFSTSIE